MSKEPRGQDHGATHGALLAHTGARHFSPRLLRVTLTSKTQRYTSGSLPPRKGRCHPLDQMRTENSVARLCCSLTLLQVPAWTQSPPSSGQKPSTGWVAEDGGTEQAQRPPSCSRQAPSMENCNLTELRLICPGVEAAPGKLFPSQPGG